MAIVANRAQAFLEQPHRMAVPATILSVELVKGYGHLH